MAKMALVNNGLVFTIVDQPDGVEPSVPNGFTIHACPDDCAVGWSFDGTTFSAPPPPPAVVPQQVSPFQARKALLNNGLLAAVEAAVAQASDEVKIAWEYGLTVDRNSAFIQAMAPALNLSSAQIDALFIEAARY